MVIKTITWDIPWVLDELLQVTRFSSWSHFAYQTFERIRRKPQTHISNLVHTQTTPFFISMCILRDLPQQKNPRPLCCRSSPNFICSCVPTKIFLFYEMGKKQGNKNRVVYIRGGSHTHVFSWGQEHTWAQALGCTSLRRTHSYKNLPYNIILYSQDLVLRSILRRSVHQTDISFASLCVQCTSIAYSQIPKSNKKSFSQITLWHLITDPESVILLYDT